MRRSLGIISGAFALRSQPLALVGHLVFHPPLGVSRQIAGCSAGHDAPPDDPNQIHREPPFWPPFLNGAGLRDLPRPEPLFFPPCELALTVAHARRSASFLEVPRFS